MGIAYASLYNSIMLQSKIITKTRKEAPAGEVAKNAILLIRAGYIDKLQAGVYTYLPLGLRVLKKIEQIIREEMNRVGGIEVLMPALHPKENWEKTGRWETMDDLYKVKDNSGREVALGPTHEEIVVPLVQQFVSSYRDLPTYIYQFQNKFRMELRSKSGILRGREFLMKDFYSFHRDEADLANFYEKMKVAYTAVFERAGIGGLTYLTYASGGSFAKYSHEYQMVTSAGEDVIAICDTCKIAINKEIQESQPNCPVCGSAKLREDKSIEVGNIFELKGKFSLPFGMTFKDESGKEVPVVMGCYGIGLGRLLGSVVEAYGDEKGIVWPKSIAPFGVHLIGLNLDDEKVMDEVKAVYDLLLQNGVEVLFDDRQGSTAGEKFADSDLIGIPTRVLVSKKSLTTQSAEVKLRESGEVSIVPIDELVSLLTS